MYRLQNFNSDNSKHVLSVNTAKIFNGNLSEHSRMKNFMIIVMTFNEEVSQTLYRFKSQFMTSFCNSFFSHLLRSLFFFLLMQIT